MPRISDALERESRTVDLEQGDFERLLGRRERKQRNRRIRAGALGVIVALVTGIILARSLTSGGIPADPRPTPTPTRTDRGEPFSDLVPVWPQTSLEEVRQAQELADAGDPRYTWQVSPNRWSSPGRTIPSTRRSSLASSRRSSAGRTSSGTRPSPIPVVSSR